MWVIPRLPEFVRAYPSVSLEIVIGDFLATASREGLDAAIQLGELPSSRLTVRKLASVDYVVCAAPKYLAERGMPRRPSDLKRPRNGHIRDWQFARGKSLETVAVNGSMILNSGEALISAASAGLGLIQVAEYYAKPSIDDGSLVEVLADYKTGSSDISVVFHGRQRMAPRLSVFIDFLVDIFDRPTWHSK
jgi:DNA-binding transcriptional LysR family regulator